MAKQTALMTEMGWAQRKEISLDWQSAESMVMKMALTTERSLAYLTEMSLDRPSVR